MPVHINGDMVARWRRYYGWSQKEFAIMIGLSATSMTYVCEIESGKRQTSRARVERMAHVLGLDIERILIADEQSGRTGIPE
jgi:transcriptional regulator with XRE-family HTH domain